MVDPVADPKVDGVRRISILGSTGSVGTSTIDLISRAPERFAVTALAGGANADLLARQARAVGARFVAIADESAWPVLRDALLGTGIEAAAGEDAVLEAGRREADWTMGSIVGAAGLAPTLEAVRRGGIVALANKESLVCAGRLFTEEAVRADCRILPVDSEHNAIFQVFDDARREGIEKIILTASGGPFRTLSRDDMARKTLAQAVAHPNWSMGVKISIDSATMMNKGLELIEAHHLFALPEERIDVLVHPQSVIHSMVSYVDGSVLAQLGAPDMRTPIAHCLAWPRRMDTPVERLDLAAIGQLSFFAPDTERFPALRLAREALRAEGDAACVMNAANEAAVAAFVDGRIGFTDIASVVEETLQRCPTEEIGDLEAVFAADGKGRRIAGEVIAGFAGVSIAQAGAAI
ncbi:1-deoxy-D-xylulose-5-phosphate reductoisomerase [Thalassobaculum litoreum]|uniref:1-deoxy-D-xylulose 5-phosphate reductoisomerase n=1 Tax=Thalassobaculum litoreum DSM 18839 TaxID=1123362 RepID=A0A8G2BLE4_9PROT|nr:1-deoxy-D-xylulose-5-phosphate reductoisomerase [Thalassobaculum litoreum]SDG39052.1 1-deoxy-D-xylulose 5-phosphate reductoisomerase [Thalassobaculum litoreum DSM 18839]